MRHLLIPIDGSDRSIEAIDAVKTVFAPERYEITLLSVREDVDTTSKVLLDKMYNETMVMLNDVKAKMPEYKVHADVEFGIAGNAIIKYAKNNDVDLIVVVRRTHKAMSAFLGSVTVHITKYAHCPVVVLPEDRAEL